MESKDELKETHMKNRTCYYFDDIMTVTDTYVTDILLDEKSYKAFKNILIYEISYKTFTGSIPLRIRSDKIDGFIKIYDGIKNSAFFDYGRSD